MTAGVSPFALDAQAKFPWLQDYLNGFYAIDLDTFHALSGRKPDPLLGRQDGQAGTPESARMNINVCAPVFRHHEAKTLLFIEEFDLSFDHGPGRRVIALAM